MPAKVAQHVVDLIPSKLHSDLALEITCNIFSQAKSNLNIMGIHEVQVALNNQIIFDEHGNIIGYLLLRKINADVRALCDKYKLSNIHFWGTQKNPEIVIFLLNGRIIFGDIKTGLNVHKLVQNKNHLFVCGNNTTLNDIQQIVMASCSYRYTHGKVRTEFLSNYRY